jgi:type VI protein secretion system component Hcp
MGDCKIKNFDGGDWFVADSFSFAVERELKESGEKGGTEDINIGVGELQECSISKSLDRTSTTLAQAAIAGNSLGQAEICFVEIGGGGEGVEAGQVSCYLYYKLDRCYVKSWSTSGDADDRPTEEVAFLYNKIAMGYCYFDGKTFDNNGKIMEWDNVKNVRSWSHNIPGTAQKYGFLGDGGLVG